MYNVINHQGNVNLKLQQITIHALELLKLKRLIHTMPKVDETMAQLELLCIFLIEM